jgi:hypothetical protein
MYSREEWFELTDSDVATTIAEQRPTAAIYMNGTRRWFARLGEAWDRYPEVAGQANRDLCQLFYEHGLQTLLMPIVGYDLRQRGQAYLRMALEAGLAEIASAASLAWYHHEEIRVTVYGNWPAVLADLELTDLAQRLSDLIEATSGYHRRRLLFGAFADEGLDRIVTLAQQTADGQALLTAYYGQPVDSVDLIVGSGQPVIWDLPLLDLNRAQLYFIQAPTFDLNRAALRHILFDSLYQRHNDDGFETSLPNHPPESPVILGLGKRTDYGWIAL